MPGPAPGYRWLIHTPAGRVRLGWRLLLFLGSALGVTAVLGAALAPLGLVGASAATLGGALAGGAWALRLDGRGPGALGFHLAPSVPWEVLGGLGLGVGLAALAVGGLTVAGGVTWARDGGTFVGWVAGAAAAAAFLALPAAAEEALVRGYPLQALADAWGGERALLVTATVFAAMHLGNPGATGLGAAGTAAAGLALGALYLRTGSLWWATGAHLGWNWGVGFGADLPVSGVDVANAPWLDAEPVGPAWLGGGHFGPEGSLVTTLAFLVAAGLLWKGRWPRPEGAALARRPLAVGGEDNADGGGARRAPANR